MALSGRNRGLLLIRRFPNIFFVFTPKQFCTYSSKFEDKETHTGQKWAENDYRLARFVNKTKQVNPNWSIKLIAMSQPIGVKGRVTSCDGGSGPTGHPKIYINLDKPGYHACIYCGLRYYKEEDHH